MIFFYLLITQMPLDQDVTWGTYLGAATLIKYLGMLCVFYAVLHLATRRSPPRYLTTVQARIFFVYLLSTSVLYWSMGSQFSIRTSPFLTYLSMAFLFFVVLSVVDTLQRLRWTLLAAVAAMGWASQFMVRAWIRHPMWRPGGATGDANYFALDACLVLPVAFLLVWQSRLRWERMFAFGCLVITILATILGASRGGLIAVSVASVWLILHSPRRLRNLVVLVILIIPPLLLLPMSPLRRLMHPQASDVTGQVDRYASWKAGLRMIKRHPLTGIGLGEFKPQMLAYADPGVGFSSIAHNTYIEVAAETGLPNFIVFLTMLFFTYRSLSQVRRRASDSGPPLVYLAATGIQAGFVGFLVGAFFLSAEYMKLFWLSIFLSMVLPSFLSARADERRKQSEYPVTLIETVPESTGL